MATAKKKRTTKKKPAKKRPTKAKRTSKKKRATKTKRVAIEIDDRQMRTRFPKGAKVAVTESKDGLEIRLDKVHVETIRDQKQRLIQAIGCYNNPGGPTC